MKPAGVAPDKPFVIVGQEGQKQVIVAVNRHAQHEGIKPGMPLTHARAVVPHVAVAPAQPAEDAKALTRLATACLRFSPLVSVSAPDSVWIDATGVAHLFGGEQQMLTRIERLLRRSGLTARVAIAPTPGAAWAWSHYGRARIILSHTTDDLDPLPITALRLSSDVAHGLWRVGIKSIGALKALPRTTIPVRFGKDVLRRLDQAVGRAAESIDAILPPRARRRDLSFAEPISTAEDIRRVAASLVNGLCVDLETQQEGACKFDLVFTRIDGSTQAMRIGTARGSRDPRHILRLFGEHFDTIDPGFGIETAELTAWRVTALFPTQTAAEGGDQANHDLAVLVDVLANRTGAQNVYRVEPVATHIPERAVRNIDPIAAPTEAPGAWPTAWPRPLHLFAPPEPVEVTALMPDYPPAQFSWRGRMRKVRIADGPERIFGEWWQRAGEATESRDYFRVEDENGERYWLFRDGRMTADRNYRWYLHGLFP